MDVFVAYSSQDEAAVRTLVAWLRRHGLSVWVAYELPAGTNWDDEIDHVLAQVPCLLVVWSATATQSAEVKGEARAAMAANKLVTVTLGQALPPRSFGHLHAVDLTGLQVDEDSPRTAQVLSGIRAKLHDGGAAPASGGVPGADGPAPASPRIAAGHGPASRPRSPLVWGLASATAVAAVGVAFHLLSPGDAAAQASCDDPQAYRLAGQRFEQDTVIDKPVVCIADNARIRVDGGVRLQVNAGTLILQGRALFDGRGSAGAAGRAGDNGPVHELQPPRFAGIAACGKPPERSAYSGKAGARGGNGGHGADIDIRYRQLEGDPALVVHDVSGGAGGAGGAGGKGGRARCRDLSPFVVEGPDGAPGADGQPGRDGRFALGEIQA